MNVGANRGEETREPGVSQRHYDPAERRARNGADRPKGRSPLFRNRSMLITILDLIVILIMFVLYLLFIRPNLGTREIEGYELRATAFGFDGQTFVSVQIGAEELQDSGGDGAQPSGAGSLVTVRFADGREIEDVLPPAGEQFVLRHVLDSVEEETEVTVILAEQVITISAPVAGED